MHRKRRANRLRPRRVELIVVGLTTLLVLGIAPSSARTASARSSAPSETSIDTIALDVAGRTGGAIVGARHRSAPAFDTPMGVSTSRAAPELITIAVTTRRPVQMIGFQWASGRRAADVVDVRWQVEGTQGAPTWSEWTGIDGDSGPDAGVEAVGLGVGLGPRWLGTASDRFEIRLPAAAAAGLQLAAIRSTGGADPAPAAIGDGRSSSAAAVTAGASASSPATNPPAILTRAQWGADESWRSYASGCNGIPSYATRVRNAIVHHTDNPNDYAAADVPAILRGIYLFHTHTNGWCDIAYNFLVDRFGRIWEGRAGGVTMPVIGAHSMGFNTNSTGVAMLGDFETGTVPDATVAAMTAVLTWKLAYHGIDPLTTVDVVSGGSYKWPAGTLVTLPVIAGHRDTQATTCPGAYGYALLPGLRRAVAANLAGQPASPMPGWVPDTGPKLVGLDRYGALSPGGSEGDPAPTAYFPGFAIARGVTGAGTVAPSGGYVLDGWGGVHPYGGAPSVTATAYWSGWDIARGISARGDGRGGYVLDGWGGLHPYGAAVVFPSAAYWRGWDIARAVAARSDGIGGYVLEGWGGVHPFGLAPPVTQTAYWPGWDIARSLALRPDGKSGWVLDGWGGLHPFGGAPPMTAGSYTPGQDRFRSVIALPDGTGGYTLDTEGILWPFGSALAVTQGATRITYAQSVAATIL